MSTQIETTKELLYRIADSRTMAEISPDDPLDTLTKNELISVIIDLAAIVKEKDSSLQYIESICSNAILGQR